MFKKIKDFGARYINYRLAWISAAFMGVVVFLLNVNHGMAGASTAAMKQAAYTFFFAGFITRNNEKLAIKGESRARAIITATVVSSCMAIGFTYLVHSLKGTPEPFLSTLPTIILAPLAFFGLAWKKRSAEITGMVGVELGVKNDDAV